MSKREKITTLYSRNGIKIERIDFLDLTKYSNQVDKGIFKIDTVVTSTKKKDDTVEVIPAQKAWDEIITRESKLGFYYYQTIHHNEKKQEIKYHKTYGVDTTYEIYTFQYDNKRFTLKYPKKCGDVLINREQCNDNSIQKMKLYYDKTHNEVFEAKNQKNAIGKLFVYAFLSSL